MSDLIISKEEELIPVVPGHPLFSKPEGHSSLNTRHQYHSLGLLQSSQKHPLTSNRHRIISFPSKYFCCRIGYILLSFCCL